VWSAFEYLDHTGDILELLGLAAAIVAEQDGVEFPSVPIAPVTDDPAPADPAALEAALSRVETSARKLEEFVAGGALTSINRATLDDGTAVTVGWLVRHALHDALHHLRDVSRNFVALGAGTPSHRGTVASINVSDGGVPKRSVATASIGYRGLVGDRQGERRHHGRVFQAVSLWSSDVIDALAADGHPIAAGAAGENLTLRGLDWAALRPGTSLRIGTTLLELSVPATPCAKNAQWFADRNFSRIHHDRAPGATRWYASVIADGSVNVGDDVVVEPADLVTA
jgi:MOSC domain-containing protein YiiM